MKRSLWYLMGLIVIVGVVLGLYFGFHKSNKPTNTSTGSNTTANNNTGSQTSSNSVFLVKSNPTLGQYLTDPNGKPLYTYNADTSGVSNCTGSCLASWPPYLQTATLPSLPTGVSTIKRTDTGATQYTYNGLPLYYFTGDSNGQVTGNGVQNFAVATPNSRASSSSNNPSSGNPY